MTNLIALLKILFIPEKIPYALILSVVISIGLLSGCSNPSGITVERTQTRNLIKEPSTPTSTPIFKTKISETPTIERKVSDIQTPTFEKNDIASSKSQAIGFSNNQVLYVLSFDMSQYLFIHPNQKPQHGWLQRENIIKLKNENSLPSAFISFSHYSEQIAFEDAGRNIWITDIKGKGEILVLDAENDQLGAIFIWTPDDQNLIIDKIDPNQNDYVYNLKTGKLQPWNHSCTQLIVSPKTKRLAIHCQSLDNNSYSVFEWGGETWIGETPIRDVVMETKMEERIFNDPILITSSFSQKYQLFSIFQNVGWSSDGKKVAYYNPQDKAGSLFVVNFDGSDEVIIPGKAYWLSDYDQKYNTIPGFPIQWSKNGKHLLIFGVGDVNSPCPSILDEQDQEYTNPGCWQVVDPQSGEVLWNAGDLEQDTPLSEMSYYGPASLSATGEMLAFYAFQPANNNLYIIDVNNKTIIISPPLRVSDLVWASE